MTYAEYRSQTISGIYRQLISRFVANYKPSCPTVILLPGGMGSQLERTRFRYPQSPNPVSDTVWIDPFDALKLAVVKNSDDAEADVDSHVVCATGPVNFFSETPYKRFLRAAQEKEWNCVVFAYDWRRPLPEAANLLRVFVRELRKSVETKFPTHDFIASTNLVAHSMGGMVLTLALRNAAFAKLQFNAKVTVATPFYGTGNHQNRYFVGQKPLNLLYPAATVANLISTLPGPYSLMFMPKAVYDRDKAHIVDLDQYPQIDRKTGGPADPFDPKFMKRWRKPVRDHFPHIDVNRAVMIEMTGPLSNEASARFYNVRARAKRDNTATYILWADIDGDDVVPSSGNSPLRGVIGPGDGTVPIWSAYHAYSKIRVQLTKAEDHGTLFEHDEVIALVESIVCKRKLPPASKRKSGPTVTRADVARANRIVKGAARRHKLGQAVPMTVFEPSVARGIFSQLIW